MSPAPAPPAPPAAPGGLIGREMTASLLAIFFMFGNLYMVFGVIPIAVRQATGSDSTAGLVTGVIAFATIITNVATPTLMGRRSPARLLAESLLVACAGTALLWAFDRSFPLLLLGGALQGLGLGVSLVVGVALVTTLAPPGRRAVAIGIYGIAAGVPAVLGPSLALVLLSSFGLRAALAAAFASGLAGAVAITALRAGIVLTPTRSHGFRAALASPTVLALFASFALVTFSFGALLTVVPLTLPKVGVASAATFLLVFGAARVVVRPVIGLLGERVGNERLYLPGLVCGVAGAVVFAVSRAPSSLFVAAALLGAGFGAFQGASYIGMLEGVARRDDGVVSSLWNFAFDGGVGLGAIAAGAVAGAYGYAPARWLLLVALALAVVTVLAMPRAQPGGSTA